jgi:CDP-glucose 4,6-dehydratase
MRAFARSKILNIRNPQATRPWQHVIDPLLGYLALAKQLLIKGRDFSEAWNFGPSPNDEVAVAQIADGLTQRWGDGAHWSRDESSQPHEAPALRLDSSKALSRLGWRPAIGLPAGLDLTVEWYKAAHQRADLRALTLRQLETVLQGIAPEGAMPRQPAVV